MLEKIKSKLFNYSTVAGFYLHWNSHQNWEGHLIVLKKQKHQLTFSQQQTGIHSIGELREVLPENIPLVLVLDGKGVLHKKVERLPENMDEIPQTVLPNASSEEFCFQVVNQSAGYWVSLVRQKMVSNLLETFAEAHISVVQLSLGIFSIQSLKAFLPASEQDFNLGYNSLIFSGNGIEDIRKHNVFQEGFLQVGQDSLENTVVPAAGAAFQVMMGIPQQIYQVSLIEQAKSNYHYQKLFKRVGWAGLLGIFSLLFINILFFTYLSGKVEQQEIDLAYHQRQLTQLDSLRKEYQVTTGFLGKHQILGTSKVSYFADELAASLPQGIQLLQLSIFPSKANQQQKRNQLFLFDKTSIYIKGTSQKSSILNEWIKTLKGMDWVQQVKVLPYSEQQGGKGTFELEVGL